MPILRTSVSATVKEQGKTVGVPLLGDEKSTLDDPAPRHGPTKAEGEWRAEAEGTVGASVENREGEGRARVSGGLRVPERPKPIRIATGGRLDD